MNIKKIIAGAAASVLAVSTMAVAASAGTVTSGLKNAADDGSGNFQVFVTADGELLYDIDVSKIASIDVTLSFDATEEDWVGGALITQCDANSWNQIGDYGTDDGRTWSNVKSGDTLTIDVGEGAFATDSTYVIVTVQNYSELAVNVDNVVFKDASGAVLLDLAGGSAAPAETEAPAADTEAPAADTEAPAATTGNTSAATADKNNADTGVEGVAVVAGVAIVAAGAIVVAKKRK